MNITRSQLRRSSSTDIERRTKPVVSPDYVVGLTDGEGCFYALVQSPFNRNGGARVQLNFFIKMQQQDRMLLEKIKNTLKCGAVYFQNETRLNHVQCYRYTVNSHRDIFNIIIPFFRRYPLQSVTKERSFEIFCKIASIVQSGLHHDGHGIERIQKLKTTMNHRTRVVREIRTLRGNAK